MRLNKLDLLVPSLEPDRPYDEAALLGMMVWLWMRSGVHQRTPLYALQNLVLPAMKYRQFLLGRENGTPVCFCSWAFFSEEAEERYLDSPKDIRDEDWRSGDRIWLIDWVAPFGHTKELARFCRSALFAGLSGHSLHHKPGRSGGDRIVPFSGARALHPHIRVPSR